MAPVSSISSMLSQDPSSHVISGIPSSSCGTTMPGPSNNGIYSSDSGASMLSCLLPNLPTLSSPHDVFRHGEMLRGMVYHDTSRHHARDMQRTDVT